MSKFLERLEYGLAGAFLTFTGLYIAGYEFVDSLAFVIMALFGATKVLQLYSSRAVDVPNSKAGNNG